MTQKLKYNLFLFVLTLVTNPVILSGQDSLEEVLRFNVPYGSHFLHPIEANGDINGDGNNDLIYICCESPDGSGYPSHVYIYHELPEINTPPDQIIGTPQIAWIGGFGCSASYSGDINGDGINDLIIGSKYTGTYNTGAVHIYFGGATLSEQPDVTLYGEDYASQVYFLFFGERIISGCDLNGDGFDDLIIYGPDVQDNNDGEVFVFLGGEPFNSTCDLHITGSLDFEFLGEGMATGDINGDGYDDIVVTKEIHNIEPEYYAVIQIYAGGTTLSNTPVFESVVGHSPDSGIGRDILADGDLNGDGFDDIIMSYYDNEGSKLRVIYGQSQFNTLSIVDFAYNNEDEKKLLFYCNLDNDAYSDFCTRQVSSPDFFGTFNVYKQTGSLLDLNCDYTNVGEFVHGIYGYGYLLGDMNHDGYQDFFTMSNTLSNQNVDYAKILTEHYTGISEENIHSPACSISCFPNPFQDQTSIEYALKETGFVILEIFNPRGQKVRALWDGYKSAGKHTATWDGGDNNGRDSGNGIYLIRIQSGGQQQVSKVLHFK
jgi:hypothetical protein